MLDLASLNQARQGLQKTNYQRHQQSMTLYEQGRQFIREAMRRPPDKAKLKLAADCFSKGIQSNYRNPSNFLGMAFLLLLTGQAPKAVPYLRQALELEPDSNLAQELLEQATRLPGVRRPQLAQQATNTAQSQTEPFFAESEDAHELDYDALYDATQAELLAFFRLLTSDQALSQAPRPDAKQLAQLQKMLTRFSVKTKDFYTQLEILDDEMDVSALRRTLAGIENALKRMTGQIRLFEQFIKIDADIHQHIELTESITHQSQTIQDTEEITRLEENLQTLLDHCDSIADALDDFEARNIDITTLHESYRRYTEKLETFQDVLEETIERLKMS